MFMSNTCCCLFDKHFIPLPFASKSTAFFLDFLVDYDNFSLLQKSI